MQIPWEPEDFEETATLMMGTFEKMWKRGKMTKEDLMRMLADFSNTIEEADRRRIERGAASSQSRVHCDSSSTVITIPIGNAFSNY